MAESGTATDLSKITKSAADLCILHFSLTNNQLNIELETFTLLAI